MNPAELDAKLEAMGLAWPTLPAPAGSYRPVVADGPRLLVSGQLPMIDGGLIAQGTVPAAVSPERAAEAARCCALNALAFVRRAIDGEWSRFDRVLHLRVYVASEPGFTGQAGVANGASDFLADLLGEAGVHARAAVGCSALPLGSPVEVEAVFRLTDG